MAKRIFYKEYVRIDLNDDIYKFYNVEIKSVGYNEFHVIYHYGRLGTEGNKKVTESKDLSEANALAWKKIYEKKSEKFENKEDLKGWLGQVKTLKKSESSRMDKGKKDPRKTEVVHPIKRNAKNNKYQAKKKTVISHECDLCNKKIPEETYDEINKWARGSGNWDKNPDFVGANRVLCIDCQWKHDIWKKRM